MKSRVYMSGYSIAVTLICYALFAAAYFVWPGSERGLTLCVLAALVSIIALFYSPMSVELKADRLIVNRPLWFKQLRLADIESIRLCQPTMGAQRVCGSGGFLGYWGWFKENDIGKYFAYYGKASDCFLVTMRNGRVYMLGCKDPGQMVEAINSALKNIRGL